MKKGSFFYRLVCGSTLALGSMYAFNRFSDLYAGRKHLLHSKPENFFNWKGIRIYYECKGSGEPVLLLHAIHPAASSFEWSDIIDRLSHNHQVYAIDLPGCGRSSKEKLPYSNFVYVELIRDFIHQMAISHPIVVASNLTCAVAVMASAYDPSLFKKMVLADTFAKGVAWGFANLSSATSGDLFLVMLFYTFEIYFDFSGYSDMAVGVSEMINITLPMNFDSPYKAGSIRDFWKRWHMSLTSFLTRYVYFPLGGSRKGSIRTYLNILIVFLVSGLWHGANWTFILWGCIHGVLQIIERIFDKPLRRQHEPMRYFCTFLAVNLLWLLFRSDSVAQWGDMLGTMFSFQNMAVSDGLIHSFVLPETIFLTDIFDVFGLNSLVRGLPMLVITVSAFLICLVPENNYRNMRKLNAVNLLLCAGAFVWAFLCLSSESVFVYFNF